MSTGLVTIQENTSIAQNPTGGFSFGGNSSMFRVKPANVELQQKTSRAEGSIEGKFRNSLTGEHYNEIHGVMIFEPTEPRSMYEDQNEFGKPPLCFSIDGEAPHPNAAEPQALSCARCRHSDWSRWKKSKKSEDLPKCKQHIRAFIVDRHSKIPYRLGIRGKSVSVARQAMGQIASLAELYLSQHGKYPELYDFSFTIKSIRKVDNKGVYYVMEFTDIKLIKEEDRAQFGELFQRFVAQRQSGELREDVEGAEDELESALTEESNFSGKTIEAAPVQAQAQEEVTI